MTLLSPTLRSLLENGKCDSEFCACVTSISDGHVGALECPEWMNTLDPNGAGISLVATRCVPKKDEESDIWGEGELICTRFLDSYFEYYPSSSIACFLDEVESVNTTSTIGKIIDWSLRDGDGPVIVSHNESYPLPECPPTLPGSFWPTMSPTEADFAATERMVSLPLALVYALALIMW